MKTCVQSALTMPRSSRQVGSQDMLKTGTRKAVLRKKRTNVFHAVFRSWFEIESWRSIFAKNSKMIWSREFTSTITSTTARSTHLMPTCVRMWSRQTTCHIFRDASPKKPRTSFTAKRSMRSSHLSALASWHRISRSQ